MNKSDLPRVATALAELGQILGRRVVTGDRPHPITVAEAALEAARAYQPGSSAARLEPSRGRRLEEVVWPEGTTELVEVPHDPAGEAAIALDRTLNAPDELLEVMARLDSDVARARRLVNLLLPPQPGTVLAHCADCGAPDYRPGKRDRVQTEVDVATEGWCRSCYRLDQRLEPIDTDRRGHRYYKDVCSWCGRFRREHKIDPPLEVLRYRHQHGRVPTHLIDKAVAEAKRNRNTQKRRRKAG